MSRIIFNDRLDATLAALAVTIVIVMVAYGIVRVRQARATPRSTAI